MLGHAAYYNSSIKNYTSVFGTLFNDISIVRTKGAKTQTVNVPLSYSSKDKAWIRRTEDPNASSDVSAIFPRMAFMLVGVQNDTARKINASQYIAQGGSSIFPPVPYNLEYELYIGTANIEDGLQIVEQILPFFNPEFSVSTKDIPSLGISMDVPIILNSVNYSDNTLDTDFSDARIIEWTLSFTVKGYLYGPVDSTKKQIKTTKAFVWMDEPMDPIPAYDELIKTQVTPTTANVVDTHTIDTTFILNSPPAKDPIV